MSDYNVFKDIEETLKTLLDNNDLWEGISPKPKILFESPKEVKESGEKTKVSVFLYQIVENFYLKNEEPLRINDVELRHPPLVLDLFYLVTPFGTDSAQEKLILGKVMQIFFDNLILSGSALKGNLSGSDEELKLLLNPLSLDDLTKLWTTFQDVPFKLSVSYMVTPVRIDSTHGMEIRRVVSKEMGYYNEIPKKEEK